MTLFPLDTVRNASVSRPLEPFLSNLRDEIAVYPWERGPERPDVDEILDAFDMARPRLNVLLSLLQTGKRGTGADISSGMGFLPVLLHRRGFLITASECDTTVAGFAAAAGVDLLHYCIGKGAPPFAPESLDFIVFAEVLEHLKLSPVFVIQQIASLLCEGGTFLLTTPNVARRAHIEALVAGENFLEPFSDEGGWGTDATDAVDHVREYSVREVVEAVEAAGLTVNEVLMTGWGDSGYNPLPNPYANEIIVVHATR